MPEPRDAFDERFAALTQRKAPAPKVSDGLVDRALDAFRDEYRRCFPRGGDAQDHDECQREGMEAAVVLVAAALSGSLLEEGES